MPETEGGEEDVPGAYKQPEKGEEEETVTVEEVWGALYFLWGMNEVMCFSVANNTRDMIVWYVECIMHARHAEPSAR